MKWFIKRQVNNNEVLPVARLALIERINEKNNVVARFIVIRFPFKRWKRHIDPRTFMHDEGWCVYRWMFGYSFTRKEWIQCGVWEPITIDEI